MLITVSSEHCDNLDRHKEPTHFTNRLPLVISIDEFMKEVDSKYFVQLEGISIHPWPKEPLVVCCNLCDVQIVGQSFKKVLSLTYGPQKFTKPKVHTLMGRTEEIEIELKAIDGEIMNIDSVAVQLSIEKY